jgi:hypothetical protein
MFAALDDECHQSLGKYLPEILFVHQKCCGNANDEAVEGKNVSD